MKVNTWSYQRAESLVNGVPYICIIHPEGSCFVRLDEYIIEVPVNRTQSKSYKVKFKVKAIHKAYKKILPFACIFVNNVNLSDDEKAQIEELFGKWNLVYERF